MYVPDESALVINRYVNVDVSEENIKVAFTAGFIRNEPR